MRHLAAPLAAAALVGGGLPNTRFGQILHEPPADQGTGGTTAAPNAVASIDPDVLQRAIAAAVAETVTQQAPAQGARSTPELNPEAGREASPEGGRSATVVDERGRVIVNPAERAQLGQMLFRYFRGQYTRNHTAVEESMRDMARAGYYGESTRAALASGERAALSTLTDADGAVFLPEVVLNEVLRIVPQYGVIRRLARTIPLASGTARFPNVASGLPAFWVGEGATIKARKAAFGKLTLDPEKMGIIVPWTSEIQEEAGAAFLDLVITLIAEAFGLLEDQTALYGDGTAVYGGITGLANAVGVNVYTMGAGKTNFNQITRDDLIGAIKKVHPSVRRNGTWVFHPDTELTLASLKDTQGRPIYIEDYREGGIPTLLGRPVEWMQAAKDEAQTAVSTVLGFYGDFSKFLLAQGRGMTSKLLDQATITDVDDATLIHLGSQDMQALRVTQRLDMSVGLPAAFVRLRTAAA